MAFHFSKDLEFRVIDVDIRYSEKKKTNDIRMFGVTKSGHSICCLVDDFEFKFLLKLSQKNTMPDHVYATIRRDENVARVCKESIGTRTPSSPKMTVLHYDETDLRYNLYEVFVKDCKKIALTARRVTDALIERVAVVSTAEAFDADIDPVLMFCIATKLKGCCWTKIPRRRFEIISTDDGEGDDDFSSRCQLNFRVAGWKYVKGLPHKDDVAPFRILAFDIECANRRGIFPEPDFDPVIQIGISECRLTEKCDVQTNRKIVLTLGSCLPIDGGGGDDVRVEEFPYRDDDDDDETETTEMPSRNDAEKRLLERFANIVRRFDPDILTGYNIDSFDIKYLLARGKRLRCSKRFFEWARISNVETRVDGGVRSTKAVYRPYNIVTMPGRLCFDMYDVIRNDYNLESYKLDDVSEKFIGDKKDDVHHSEITGLFRGTSSDRRRLAEYCLQDVNLVVALINKLMSLVNYIELSRIYGVGISYLSNRGQQIKVKSMIYRYIGENGTYVIPYVRKTCTETNRKRKNVDSDDEEDDKETNAKKRKVNYQGATVMEPVVGLHDKSPTIVLDFSSLYPSIIRRYNLCYSTHISSSRSTETNDDDDDDDENDKKDVNVTPVSAAFVTPQRRKGILPEILKDLIEARNETKIAMKNETDEFKKKILNGKQLALKISANSIYGFTGAASNNLYCVDISSSVTGYGRRMLEETKTFIEDRFRAVVVYGDTDSVMFNLPDSEYENVSDKRGLIKVAVERGKDIARTVTRELFEKPVSLEFEKVMFPLFMCSKKRYCGMSYESSTAASPKMDLKGLQAVRRDNCEFVRRTQTEFLRAMMTEDRSTAVEYLRDRIRSLLDGEIPTRELTMTKTLRCEYKNAQEHDEVRRKMLARDATTAPQIGDRVAFVYVVNTKSKRACDKAEDPVYAESHSLPLDYGRYLDRLKKSLEQIVQNDEIVSQLFNK